MVLHEKIMHRFQKLCEYVDSEKILKIQIEKHNTVDDFKHITRPTTKYFRGKWLGINDVDATELWGQYQIYHRNIKSNEIVIDLDFDSFEKNQKYMFKICKILDSHYLNYYVYYSGGKGFHIHFFYNYFISSISKQEGKVFFYLDVNERLFQIRKSILKNLGFNIFSEFTVPGTNFSNGKINLYYKNMFFFVDEIQLQIGIKTIDFFVVDELKLKSQNTMIRLEGSYHHKGKFKTFLGSSFSEVSEKISLNNFKSNDNFELDNIRYSRKINNINFLAEKILKDISEIYRKNKKVVNLYKTYSPIKKVRNSINELLQKSLQDGRKHVLKILSWELFYFYRDEKKVLDVLKKWNELPHKKGNLSENDLIVQLNFVKKKSEQLGSNFLPFSNEKLRAELKKIPNTNF